MSWQDLAKQWAVRYGADPRVVLATVEAEGAANVMGDGGQAYGFGQVWPTWHTWAFVAASHDTGVTDLSDLRAAVLGNDAFSMATAVLVIKSYWDSASGSTEEARWEDFTRHYVGSGIPAADMERRRLIWHEYAGGASTSGPGTPAATVTQSGDNSLSVQFDQALPSVVKAGALAVAGLVIAALIFGSDA